MASPNPWGLPRDPVTISPDGSAITALGPDAYPVDQIWYGTWQIFLPSPLKTAAIPPATLTFTTDYQTTLAEPAGTLTQYAEFNLGVSATLVTRAALCLFIRAERGWVIQLYTQTGLC